MTKLSNSKHLSFKKRREKKKKNTHKNTRLTDKERKNYFDKHLTFS